MEMIHTHSRYSLGGIFCKSHKEKLQNGRITGMHTLSTAHSCGLSPAICVAFEGLSIFARDIAPYDSGDLALWVYVWLLKAKLLLLLLLLLLPVWLLVLRGVCKTTPNRRILS